jgi:Glycosyl transferase family 2
MRAVCRLLHRLFDPQAPWAGALNLQSIAIVEKARGFRGHQRLESSMRRPAALAEGSTRSGGTPRTKGGACERPQTESAKPGLLFIFFWKRLFQLFLMNWPEQCAVVIPCLNEERTIGPLVAAVRRRLPTVFVVDDGSSDRTARLAAEAGAEVLRHEKTRGKGAALQTGWRRSYERGFQWALSMDGDGQHSPDDISSFLNSAGRTMTQLTIGNRMNHAGRMPWLRRCVNRWMSRRISIVAGQPLPDSQCGFRLMNLEAWATLPISALHFEIESDVLLAFAARNCRIEFVPVRVIYKNGRSKIDPLRDTVRWLRWWHKARRNSMLKADVPSAAADLAIEKSKLFAGVEATRL